MVLSRNLGKNGVPGSGPYGVHRSDPKMKNLGKVNTYRKQRTGTIPVLAGRKAPGGILV